MLLGHFEVVLEIVDNGFWIGVIGCTGGGIERRHNGKDIDHAVACQVLLETVELQEHIVVLLQETTTVDVDSFVGQREQRGKLGGRGSVELSFVVTAELGSIGSGDCRTG